MSRLIRTPGGYRTAFFKGFLGTLVAFVAPLTGLAFEVHPKLAELPRMIGTFALISFTAALIVGLLCVVPRWAYAWAYRRVTGT